MRTCPTKRHDKTLTKIKLSLSNFKYRFSLHNLIIHLKIWNFGCKYLSAWHELEDLQKKRAELEFQLHSLEEKERTLEEKAKIMQEKLAIQELEEHLKIKHEAVEQLESKIMELEKKIKEQEKKQERPIFSEPQQEEEKTEYFFH